MRSKDDGFIIKSNRIAEVQKTFKKKLSLQVGILGSSKRDGGQTNAQVGMLHEFGGTTKIGKKEFLLPQRSFLRIPLTTMFDTYLNKSKIINKRDIDKCVKNKSLALIFSRLGILAERIIQDAFATGGFGKWKPSNMKYKKNKQTLVETQQLRNSITSTVVEK